MDLTLYKISDHLQALLDTRDMTTDPDEAASLELEIQKYAAAEVEKVDSFAGYLRTCDAVVEFLKQREHEIATRRRQVESRIARLEKYAVAVIEALPRVIDKKGRERYAKLEGREATLTLREGRTSVQITQELAVPAKYKTITLTVPAEEWENHLQRYNEMREMFNFTYPTEPSGDLPRIFRSVIRVDVAVDKRKIKAAIDAGQEVPGAELTFGDPSLSR